jgi:hypothetical protein
MTAEAGTQAPAGAHGDGAPATWTASALLRWLSGAAPLDPPLSQERSWRSLADRCEKLRVLPQAMLRITSESDPRPQADRVAMAHRRIEATASCARRLHFGCRALASLRDAGIAAAGFKGIAAIGRLHQGQPARGIGDVDVLVSPASATRALEVLQDAGFRSKVEGLPTEAVIAFARSSPGSAGNESISLMTAEGIEVDLHWKLGAFDVDAALAQASPVRVLGDAVPLVRPGLGLLLSAHHALRNDFVPDEVIRDLLDANGWFRQLVQDPAEAAWADREAHRTGLDVAVEACAEILADSGVAARAQVPSPGTAARALADLFRDQLARPMNTDLVYLCSMRPCMAILAGLLRGGRGYLRAMRAVEHAHGEASVPLHARLGRLMSEAWSAPGRRWSQVRTLARAKDRAGSPRGAPKSADTGGV